MGVNYTRIAEGDAFTAASLNDRFTAVADEINAMGESNLQRYALSDVHIDDSTLADPNVDIAGTVESEAATLQSYVNYYPGYNTDTFNDPPTGLGGDVEWNLVSDGTNDARLTWTQVDLYNNAAPFGIVVLANVERAAVSLNGTGTFALGRVSVAFALQYLDSGDVWRTIQRTERFITGEIVTATDGAGGSETGWIYGMHDVGIRTLITAETVGGALGPNAYIKGVQLVCSLNPNSAASPPAYASGGYEIGQWNITALPLRGELS